MGWGPSREGGWTMKQAYVLRKKGGVFRGIFGIFQEPLQSGFETCSSS